MQKLVNHISFVFWVSVFSSLVVTKFELVDFCTSVFVGSLSVVWVLGTQFLGFAKLEDHNFYTIWLKGILITGSNLILFNYSILKILTILCVSCMLLYGLPILKQRINKYIT